MLDTLQLKIVPMYDFYFLNSVSPFYFYLPNSYHFYHQINFL